MDIFYHAINYTSKGIIDVVCCGTFNRKSAEEVNQLSEDLAKSNHKSPSEASGSNSRLGGGVIELNKMTAIEAKLDAPMSKLGNQERRVHTPHEVGTMEGGEQKCIANKELALEGPYQIEEAHYVNGSISYNFKPNNNLPILYTLALRNHENFSYGIGVQKGPRPMQNFSSSTLHKVSKDSSSMAAKELKTSAKGSPSLLRFRCSASWVRIRDC